jgi:hypothetical protein
MKELETIGKLFLILGGTLALLGGLLWLISKVPFLSHLPGDIRVEKPGFTCLIPLASSIILSIVLTIVLNIVVRLINH